MKKLLFIACALSLFIGCTDSKRKLYVYNWADYIDPDLVAEFEKQNNCTVVIDQFDDNEAMLAKMLAGADGYDLIFPSSYIINMFKKNDLIQKIDLTKIPNVMKNIDRKYDKLMFDKTLNWSVPYAFSMTGICYRKDIVKCNNSNSNSWNILTDPSTRNRVCILNDVREIIGIGLKCNGYSCNSTNDIELAKALKTALKFKYVSNKADNLQYKSGMACGEFYVCMGYNSDVLQLREEMPELPIEFFIPKEGSVCCFDEMCISKSSKNVDLALKFIDFLYVAENAAKNAIYICAAVPNKEIWKHMTDKYTKDPMINVPNDILNRLEMIKDVEHELVKYKKIWDEFKSTKK
jgi:spermidine/putrescine transport system substrate-binding protein